MAGPGPLNPGGTALSLADAIRAQAASQAKQAAVKSGLVDTTDPLDQLAKQIQGINVAATPYDELLGLATSQAGAQYNPLIEELKGQMAATRTRAGKNSKQAQAMYGDLAKDIAGQMPAITGQMNAAQEETKDRYAETQRQLQGEYNQQAEQQAALYKKLGIQAAAPEASQQAMDDQAYFQQQSNADEDAALTLLNQMKAADVSYNQQSANNTNLAGVNAAQDIQSQLEDYLQQAGSKMSGLEAGKSSAIQAALGQLQQEDKQRIASQEEQQYNQLMDMFNLQLKMQQMQADANASEPLFKGINSTSGAANYLGEVYGGNNTAVTDPILKMVQGVLSSPVAMAGEYDSGRDDVYGDPVMTKVTDEYLNAMLRKAMMKDNSSHPLTGNNWTAEDINHAIATMAAMRGKLK